MNKYLKTLVISDLILSWYEKYGRSLPWRMKGKHKNPYYVLVSEFMLQQTKVKTVIPYYNRFIKTYDTITKLSTASIDDILVLWKGLGYYNRAHRLYECSKIINYQYNNIIPKEYEKLIKLPGIGKYTASSLRALIYDLKGPVIDGNVQRVICRYYNYSSDIDKIKKNIEKKAMFWEPNVNVSDYTSAIIDLGAIVCIPKNPHCEICPLNFGCISYKKKTFNNIPLIKKIIKEKRYWKVFFIYDSNKKILIKKNIERSLYFGLYEFPWISLNENKYNNIINFASIITHKFTNFDLYIKIILLDITNKKHNLKNSKKSIFIDFNIVYNYYPISKLFIKILNEGINIIKSKN